MPVAAGSPERVSGAEDAWRFTLELEQHLTVNHVTESRPARKAMWRLTRGARWMADENSHHMGIVSGITGDRTSWGTVIVDFDSDSVGSGNIRYPSYGCETDAQPDPRRR